MAQAGTRRSGQACGAVLIVVTACFADDPAALLAEARPVARQDGVDSKIVWMKLASLAEGARRASKQLWAKAA